MSVVLVVLLLASLMLNVWLLTKLVKLGKSILAAEVAVEECLDGLDGVYSRVSKILQLPLASNDPKVFQIHRELQQSRDYLLLVANRLTSGWSKSEEGGER